MSFPVPKGVDITPHKGNLISVTEVDNTGGQIVTTKRQKEILKIIKEIIE